MKAPNDNDQRKIEILYDEQRSLLERLQIHQRNLNHLLSQKANYGLEAPLHILNGIGQQEDELNAIKKRLGEIDSELDKLSSLKKHNSNEGENKPVVANFHINGVDYTVEVPFPYLRTETTGLASGKYLSRHIYAGGFEIHSVLDPGKNLASTFFLHGQRIVPVVDVRNKKLVIPLGYAVIVPKVKVNTQHAIIEEDIEPKTIAEGSWTVISPAPPKSSSVVNDWPQGMNNAFWITTKVEYEGDYVLWIVQSTIDPQVRLWFYEQGWNVGPTMNQGRLSLSFPMQEHHT
jgi:hypothetical protein